MRVVLGEYRPEVLTVRIERAQRSPCKKSLRAYRRIHADVIVYIFAHLHTVLRIEGNMLDMN